MYFITNQYVCFYAGGRIEQQNIRIGKYVANTIMPLNYSISTSTPRYHTNSLYIWKEEMTCMPLCGEDKVDLWIAKHRKIREIQIVDCDYMKALVDDKWRRSKGAFAGEWAQY